MIIAGMTIFIGAGVYSYFSDVETTTANTFTTGTLDLKVGDANPTTEQINITELKPGDTGSAANWTLQNIGSITGDLNISVGAITNNENARSDLEEATGDTTGGATEGELGANLLVAFWMDVDRDNTWSTGDYYLASTGSKVSHSSGSTLPSAAYDVLNSYDSDEWANVETDFTGLIGYFKVEYELPAATTNVVQSDSSVFNITFTLMQHI